jgi:hypothetical protein
MASNSPGGKFNSDPVPENPKISAPFSQQLDNVLGCTTRNNEAVGVVIVYAFDCTTSTPAWYKMDDVYSLVEEKLTDLVDTIGYIFVMSTPNTYRSDMKSVDSAETQKTGYKKSPAWCKAFCTKQMACGLDKAHKLISHSGNKNGIILVFSDGSTHKGDFFDGAKDFVSKVPVHTFILYGQD